MTTNERTATANYSTYKFSDMYSLFNAYASPSYNKVKAWERCKEICNNLNGHGLKVVSKNTFVFTAGFTFEKDGKKYYCHITPNHTTSVEI